jgi:hypothetical protein
MREFGSKIEIPCQEKKKSRRETLIFVDRFDMNRTIYLMLILLTGSVCMVKGQNLTEPVKPAKANDSSPVIRLDVDTTSFRELAIYPSINIISCISGQDADVHDAVCR